jgi:hypothetical protein
VHKASAKNHVVNKTCCYTKGYTHIDFCKQVRCVRFETIIVLLEDAAWALHNMWGNMAATHLQVPVRVRSPCVSGNIQ